MVFVGVLEAYMAEGLSVGRLMGTSAGAITATFLAAGYTIDEVQDALKEKNGMVHGTGTEIKKHVYN